MDQKLFREIENIRGREKRSTFIENLIILGLKAHKNKKEEFAVNGPKAPLTFLSHVSRSETRQ
jgi:hypothetical protein